jgi:hypothetical protein
MTTTQNTYSAVATKNGWYNITADDGTIVEKVRGYRAHSRAEVLTCGHAIRCNMVASFRFKDGRPDVHIWRMTDGTYQCDVLPDDTSLMSLYKQVFALGDCSLLP